MEASMEISEYAKNKSTISWHNYTAPGYLAKVLQIDTSQRYLFIHVYYSSVHKGHIIEAA